jgi:hypothetical protein
MRLDLAPRLDDMVERRVVIRSEGWATFEAAAPVSQPHSALNMCTSVFLIDP